MHNLSMPDELVSHYNNQLFSRTDLFLSPSPKVSNYKDRMEECPNIIIIVVVVVSFNVIRQLS